MCVWEQDRKGDRGAEGGLKGRHRDRAHMQITVPYPISLASSGGERPRKFARRSAVAQSLEVGLFCPSLRSELLSVTASYAQGTALNSGKCETGSSPEGYITMVCGQ